MELSREGEVALLRMRAGKANAMGPAFLDALAARLDELASSDAAAAVITGDGRFFSAGLALPEVVEHALERSTLRTHYQTEKEGQERLENLDELVSAASNFVAEGVLSGEGAAPPDDRHPLLADFHPKGEVARKYGAYREQDGVSARALFLVDGDGVIRWSYLSPVGVAPGVNRVLRALESLYPEAAGHGS